MPQDFEIVFGKWWRFDRYEVRDGYIRPATGAELHEYDPWQRFADAKTVGKALPYEELLDVSELLPDHLDPRAAVPSEVVAPLLRWHRRFGALGVLLQSVQAIHRAAVWRPLALAPPGKAAPLVPTVDYTVRTSRGWSHRWTQPMSPVSLSVREGDLVDHSKLPPSGGPAGRYAPRILVRAGEAGLQEESPSKRFATFFPDVPLAERDRYQYPAPLTGDFWRQYAEPVWSFAQTARSFRRAIDNLAAQDFGSSDPRVLRGARELERMIGAVAAVIRPLRTGRFQLAWGCGSLIESLAMMQALDLSAGALPRNCKGCGKPIVTTAYQTKYCSDPRCKWRVQKQEHRAKQRLRARDKMRS